jgi:hypothetical protein
MKRFARLFLAGAAVFLAAQCNPALASSSVTMPGGWVMNSTLIAAAGQTLPPNAFYYSPNRRYFLVFQSDGNLVVYRAGSPDVAIASTGTNGATLAAFQTDGNFVIYKGNTAVWNSGTQGTPNGWNVAQLRIWDDGRLTIEGASGMFSEGAPDPQTWSGFYTYFISPGCVNGTTQWGVVQPMQNMAGSNFYGKPFQLNRPQGSCTLN